MKWSIFWIPRRCDHGLNSVMRILIYTGCGFVSAIFIGALTVGIENPLDRPVRMSIPGSMPLIAWLLGIVCVRTALELGRVYYRMRKWKGTMYLSLPNFIMWFNSWENLRNHPEEWKIWRTGKNFLFQLVLPFSRKITRLYWIGKESIRLLRI